MATSGLIYNSVQDQNATYDNNMLGDVSCKHIYNYYWKRGKCKGSKCILCGNLDRTLKPNVG